MLGSRLVAAATLVVGLSGCAGEDGSTDLGLTVPAGVSLGLQAKEVGSLALDGLCITGDDAVELVSVEALSAEQNLTVTDFDVVSVPDDSLASQAQALTETGWTSLKGRVTSKCGESVQALGLEMSKTTGLGRAESMRFTYRVDGEEQTQTVAFDVTLCSRFKAC